jgi:hypothetical protein
MNRSLKRKLAAGAAVAVLLAGGAVAAVSATGQTGTHAHGAARHSGHRAGGQLLASAASYLGLTVAQVRGDLQSGRTLAQVASATSGKSPAGLIEAIVAARRASLATDVADLTRRVTDEVNRPGGPGLRGFGARSAGLGLNGGRLLAARGVLGSAAASYLGLTAAQLRSDLRSGRSLADLANATSGRSPAGLVSALVTARKAQIATAVADGRLSQTREDTLVTNLPKRMTALVNRTLKLRRQRADK